MKADQQTARALNRRMILNLLRKKGPLSRAELAGLSGLSPAAVTFVTGDLVSEGLISEGEAIKGAGGRRPIPMLINWDARLTIGFKLNAAGLEAVLADLSTAPLKTVFRALPDTAPETVVAHAADIVQELMPDAADRRARLVGIGLALPGSYDVAQGVCMRLARFGWTDVPVGAMLAARTDVPVWVDNDVNAFALAQHLFGSGQSHGNMLALAIGAGIGAAFMTEGAIHRGSRGGAGEIGHITIDPDGPQCECGRRGCAQTYWSEAAMNARWAPAAAAANLPADLEEALAQSAPAAIDFVTEAGQGLGRMLAQVNTMVDPDIVIVGGEGVRFGETFRSAIETAAHASAFDARPAIVFDWQHDSWPRGAAALAAQHFFNFEAEGETA